MFAFNDYLLFLLSYIIGSIPFGIIVVKFAGLGNIYKEGSGNIGATNIVRVAGKKLGIITFLLDLIKGFIPSFLYIQFFADDFSYKILALIGLITILAHCYPIWLKFKGGKGVATALGVILAAKPLLFLMLILTWFAIFKTSKTSSIAALGAFGLLPFIAFLTYPDINELTLTSYFIISLIIFVRHYENIKRLLNNDEKSFK